MAIVSWGKNDAFLVTLGGNIRGTFNVFDQLGTVLAEKSWQFSAFSDVSAIRNVSTSSTNDVSFKLFSFNRIVFIGQGTTNDIDQISLVISQEARKLSFRSKKLLNFLWKLSLSRFAQFADQRGVQFVKLLTLLCLSLDFQNTFFQDNLFKSPILWSLLSFFTFISLFLQWRLQASVKFSVLLTSR